MTGGEENDGGQAKAQEDEQGQNTEGQQARKSCGVWLGIEILSLIHLLFCSVVRCGNTRAAEGGKA